MSEVENFLKKRKLTSSFKDAFRGIFSCVKKERNIRIHITFMVYVLFFSAFLNLERFEIAILCAVIGMTIAFEIINTAVEKLCDFACDKMDKRIGLVKDIAAGAVLVSALTSVAVGIIILFKPVELMNLANIIFGNIYYIILFVISLVLSFLFIKNKK